VNAKGAILVQPIKFLRRRRAEALPLLRPELHHYLDERVALSSWYPESDFAELMEAVVALSPGAERVATIEKMGELGARAHAEIYGDLIRTLSTSTVFALWSSQHDSGELRVVQESATTARVELTNFDSPSDVVCLLTSGYIRGGLSWNGMEDVVVAKLLCTVRGDRMCAWRANWKDPEATPVTPARRRARSPSRR